jgi:hypothetical protein
MNALAPHATPALESLPLADALEAVGLRLPQVDAPVLWRFAPGIAVRECLMRASVVPGVINAVVGRSHKREHLNVMLTGRLLLIGDDGAIRDISAPQVFTAPPGRKVALILEDVTWQNYIATDERDHDALDALMFDDSTAFTETAAQRFAMESFTRAHDREDYAAFLREFELPADHVRALSEDVADQIPMPFGVGEKTAVRRSTIEGTGVFASSPIERGEVIGPARIDGKRTPLGRYTNHAASPNARFESDDLGDIHLVATCNIRGCNGGDFGEEIVVDYRQALAVNIGSKT